MRTKELTLGLALLASVSCKKEETSPSDPIDLFRVLDVNVITATQDPSGGYILQCMEDEDQKRLDYAQFITAEGELAGRIDYRELPDSIEGIRFHPASNLRITDIIPWSDGGYILLGEGDAVINGRAERHLLVYHVDGNGQAIAPPLRRFVAANCYHLVSFGEPLWNHKALGARLTSGDLIVTVKYQTIYSGKLRYFRFPFSGPTQEVTDSITVEFESQLWSVQSLPGPQDRAVVIVDQDQEYLLAQEIRCEADEFFDQGGLLSHGDLKARAVFQDGNGHVRVAGSSWYEFPDGPGAFIAGFPQNNPGAFATSYRQIEVDAPAGEVSQCYAATSWGDNIAMLINTYPSATDAPYHTSDIVSDLSLALVDPGTGDILSRKSLVEDQGLRGMAMFNDNGQLVCIGKQFAYENIGIHHTIFMKLKDPFR